MPTESTESPESAPPAPRSLRSLLADVRVVEVHGELDRPVDRVTRDSRAVGPRSVFVAVPGANVDGHAFVPTLDAAAVVVERPVAARPGTTVVRVEACKPALAALSAALHDHPGRALSVVAVTGTNGKTTVTTLIEQALMHLRIHVGRIGTTGNAIDGVAPPHLGQAAFTTPEAPELQALLAEMRRAGCAVVAIEASSIGLAQHRVDAIPYAVAVFTNLTQDHLDFHGTMDRYREAKARLFRELLRPAGGMPRAVICADDPAHTAIGAPADRWTYGFRDGADLQLRSIALDLSRGGPSGTVIALSTPDAGDVVLRTPLVGRHNALNAVAAFGVLRCLGISVGDALAALATVAGAPGRLEQVPDPGGRVVLVDYAHSDDALANVLPAIRELVTGQLWVLFGCGGDRDRGKRPKMGSVAARLADRIVVTTDNPRTEDPSAIAAEILAGIPDDPTGRPRVHLELDREAAIRWVLAQAAPGDAVLLAGKGHETYQEVAGIRRPFDDRAIARRALEGR
ncbi:MAG: UDP-N-acetylmuramoyl-L-alanyl-D-glutamate--2,6-diaminopimelate ligase [Myxococcota bacterium]